ncbi:MAG: PepSY-associated TM helix domain-containing protein, partial [Acidobacteriota bacterium]
MTFLDHPQRLWWRRALFQVHLWVGVMLCVYMLVIGLSGSVLVFRGDLEPLSHARLLRSSSPAGRQPLDFVGAMKLAQQAYPGEPLSLLYLPTKPGSNIQVNVVREEGREISIYIDPYSRQIIGTLDSSKSWWVWMRQLHIKLLAGRTGSLVNGIGSIFLLLLCITGLVIWWPGVKLWTRGFKVNFRLSWKRINYDLHSATGFWTLLVLSMWAVTGIYLIWAAPIQSVVGRYSSVASMNPPEFRVAASGGKPWTDMNEMIRQAERSCPDARFVGAFFPNIYTNALTLLMAPRNPENHAPPDFVFFDPVTGKQVAIWHRQVPPTWGVRLLGLM